MVRVTSAAYLRSTRSATIVADRGWHHLGRNEELFPSDVFLREGGGNGRPNFLLVEVAPSWFSERHYRTDEDDVT